MTEQYTLSPYKLTDSPEEDVQHFFNVMKSLKTYLAKARQEKTYISVRLQQADRQNNFIAMVGKDLTAEHIRSAKASINEINQRLGETQSKVVESKREVRRLKQQQIDNEANYKKLIVSEDVDGMKASEDLAVEITQSLARHDLRLNGFGAVADDLEAKVNLYRNITSAGRQSLLRQNALASFERYKESAKTFAKQFDEVSAYMDVAEFLIPDGDGLNPLAYLKKITFTPGRTSNESPEFRALKQSLEDNIDNEIDATV